MTMAEVAKPAGPAQALALVRALRVHQWVKNLLVFVPVVLDHKLFSTETVAKSATAFAAFCCSASSAGVIRIPVREARDAHSLPMRVWSVTICWANCFTAELEARWSARPPRRVSKRLSVRA